MSTRTGSTIRPATRPETTHSLLDELDVNDIRYSTAKRFNDRREAEAWLIAAIKANKTFFGVGDLIEMCTIKPANRCRECTCGGERRERSWHVEESGRLDEHHFDDCFMEG